MSNDDRSAEMELIARLIGVADDEVGHGLGPVTLGVDDGMGDGCWFCGGDPIHDRYDTVGAAHEASCPWVAAMRLLGQDLDRHTVKPMTVYATTVKSIEWLGSSVNADTAPLTLPTLQKAFEKIVTDQEAAPVCGFDTPHVIHPREAETGGWAVCAQCGMPVEVEPGGMIVRR